MTSSKILFYLSISFIIGIFFESLIKIPHFFIWGILIFGVIFVSAEFLFSKFLIRIIIRIKKYFLVAGFCMMFLVLGILRMQISEFNIANDKLSKLNGAGEVSLTGTILGEPDIRDSSQKLKIKIADSIILVTTNRYPEYNYLDKVKIIGKLESPAEFDDFNYKNYLMKDGIYSVMGFPKIELVSNEHDYNIFSYLYEKVLNFKQKMRQSIRDNFSFPQSSVLEGIILGNKKSMPQDLKDNFSNAGLSHIVAVSGMHVMILSTIIMFFLLALGFYRGQAFYISVIFICFYVVLTGFLPSAVRAGIMGLIYLYAQKIGRQSASSRTIVIAGSAMLLLNPLLLLYDIGFQLSFLAVLGLIYFEPLIRKFFKFLAGVFYKKDPSAGGKKNYENAFSIFSATIAAQIFTFPIILFNFGNVSFFSPFANVFALPVVEGIMFFGFLSSLAGIFSGILAWILAVPCYFMLNYLLWVADFFSKPWMHQNFQNVSWVWIVVSYFAISFTVRYLRKKYTSQF